jgi:photosystem II stability/assembly factor-like uncharacterized protein
MLLAGLDDQWTLTQVEFASQDTGFIAGYRQFDRYFQSALFRTTNRGETWERIELSYDEHFFYHTSFPSQRTGYLAVSTADPGGDSIVFGTIILKTTDAGATWNESYRVSDHMGSFEIVFRDTLHGIVMRSSLVEGFTEHTLLITSDGGDTWQTVNPCPSRESGCISLTELAHVSDSIWVMSDNSTQVLRSTDDGATWSDVVALIPFPSLESIFGIRFADDLTGYACGTPRREIFKTTDGGLSWNAQQSNADEYMSSISTPGKTVAYACGTHGRIVKTFSGGSLQSDGEGDRSEELHISISPNPMVENALIRFSPAPATQQLRIYDIPGRVVLMLPVPQGASSLSLNTLQFPPGTYFCQFGNQTARFVVVR